MKVRVDAITTYKDGGTKQIVLSDGLTYYVDNRLLSTTKGEVYASYPKGDSNLSPVTDREKEILIACLEEYGKESAMYDVGATIYTISATMVKPESWSYTVVNVHTENTVVGYTIITDNGDEQYLTVQEFTDFKIRRTEV